MASVALHLVALLVLGSGFGARFDGLAASRRPRGPVMQARLIRWPDADVRAHLSPPRPALLPTPAAGRAPRPPPDDAASPPLAETVVASLPEQEPADLDGLYSAPFVDATAQAYASLRGGLGCAHVDLAALPAPLRAVCEAARKRAAP